MNKEIINIDDNLSSHFFQKIQKTKTGPIYWPEMKNLDEMDKLKSESLDFKKKFILDSIDYYKATCFQENNYKGFISVRTELWEIATVLMQKNLNYTQAEWCALFTKLADTEDELPMKTQSTQYTVGKFPILKGIKQLENVLKRQSLNEKTQQCIVSLLERDLFTEPARSEWVDLDKILLRLKALLPSDTVTLFKPVDAGNKLNSYLESLSPRDEFYALFLLLSNSRPSKPSKKWLNSLHELQEQLGKDRCAEVTYRICDIILTHNRRRIKKKLATEWICDAHIDLLKGVVWSLENQKTQASDDCLMKLLFAGLGKQEDSCIYSIKLGNACLSVLENRASHDNYNKLKFLTTTCLDNRCKTRVLEIIDHYSRQLQK